MKLKQILFFTLVATQAITMVAQEPQVRQNIQETKQKSNYYESDRVVSGIILGTTIFFSVALYIIMQREKLRFYVSLPISFQLLFPYK